MDIEKEIKAMVRSAVMEEINNLGIRAVVREQIEKAGFTHEDVRNIIREMADSYFRSAMDGNVECGIRSIYNKKVEEVAEKAVNAAAKEYTGWQGRDAIKKLIDAEIKQRIVQDYDFKVTLTIEPKASA